MDWIKVEGYKFVGQDLKALRGDYQYKIGDNWLYSSNKPIKMCSWGFHFSPTLETVENWGNIERDRLFKCVGWVPKDILGKHNDKLVTDHLILGEEVTKDSMEREFISNLLKEFKQLSTQHPSLVLGGSLALKLQGFEIDREIGDMDLNSPYYIELYEGNNKGRIYEKKYKKEDSKEDEDLCEELFGVVENDLDDLYFGDTLTSGQDIVQSFIRDIGGKRVKVELITDTDIKYRVIEFEGEKYKVQDSSQIWNAKFRYSIGKATTKKKHVKDILNMYKNIYPDIFKNYTPKTNIINL
jgi:hypothetical protein